jgi:hypothetical protein
MTLTTLHDDMVPGSIASLKECDFLKSCFGFSHPNLEDKCRLFVLAFFTFHFLLENSCSLCFTLQQFSVSYSSFPPFAQFISLSFCIISSFFSHIFLLYIFFHFSIIISDVNVSFFVIENNLFFAFDHKKANVSFFYAISKLKY